MESRGRTEISIGIGQVSSNPGISISLDILIGGGNTSKLKSEIQQKTGHQFDEFHGYVLFSANSEESAHALQHILEGAWNKALTGEAVDEISQMIKEKVKPSDEEEAMVKMDFSVHGSHVVVKVSGNDMYRETIEGSVGMATGFVGPVLEHDQHVHVEFDVEKSFTQIFHSENPILTGFNSMKFNVVLGINTALSSHGASIAEGFGAPPQILHALGLLGLYENANLDLQLLSADKLPAQITEKISELNSGAMLQMGKEMAPDDFKSFIRKIGEHSTGEIQVVGGFSSVMAQLKIHVPGLFHVFNQG